MGRFNFALIKDEEKEKKPIPGWAQRMRGIGTAQTMAETVKIRGEVGAGVGAIGKFDSALKPILLTTIEEEEKELKDFETTYEALNDSIAADYNQYMELEKQLEELNLSMQEAPEELTWYLQKKFEEVRATHNSLVDKIKADTSEQKTIYESYAIARESYEKDVDTYNRSINAGRTKPEAFIPPDYSSEEITRQLKEGTFVTHKKPDTLRTVLGAYATFGKGLSMLPKAVKVTFLQATGGGKAAGINDTEEIDTLLKNTKDLDEFVKEAYMRYGNEGIFGIKITDLAELPQNLSYSIVSSGAGAAVGIPIAFIPFPGMRALAWASGTAVSGLVCYRATEFQITQSYLEFKNEESMRETGKPLNVAEEKLLKETFAADAKKYALWEAVPEALSNLNFWGTLAMPLTKTVGKSAAGAIINKLSRMYLGEFSTEMITQMGQSSIEAKAGMRGRGPMDWTNPRDYMEALKEIAPQTFLLTTVMGGAGSTVIETSKAFKKITKNLKAEIGENNPLLALTEAKLTGMLVEQRGSFSWKDTSKKISPEIEEARKYKTVEEYVEAQFETEVFYPVIRGERVEIIKNPSEADERGMEKETRATLKKVTKELLAEGVIHPDELQVRELYDDRGNRYIFRGDLAVHEDIDVWLEENKGTLTGEGQLEGAKEKEVKRLTAFYNKVAITPTNIERAKEQLIKRGVREKFLTPGFMKKFMEHPEIQELEKGEEAKVPISEEEALEKLKDMEEIEASAEELIAAAKDVEPTSEELDKIKKVNVAKEKFEAAWKKAVEKKRAAEVKPVKKEEGLKAESKAEKLKVEPKIYQAFIKLEELIKNFKSGMKISIEEINAAVKDLREAPAEKTLTEEQEDLIFEILDEARLIQETPEENIVYRTEKAAKIYRGKRIWGQGLYFGMTRLDVEYLMEEEEEGAAIPDYTLVKKYVLPDDIKLKTIDIRGQKEWKKIDPLFKKKILAEGYDGIKVLTGGDMVLGGDQIVIYNPEMIKRIMPSEEVKVKEELKVEGKVYEGKAFRAETKLPEHGAEMIAKMKTAKEKLDYDYGITGNVIFKNAEKIAKDLGIDVKKVPIKELVWVAPDLKTAEKYGEAKEIKLPEDTIVLAKDEEGGSLVLRNSEKYKVEPKAPIEIEKAFALEKREEVETFIKKEYGEKIPVNELVTLGPASDWIIDKRLRAILKDVLDTQITVTEKFERPTIHGEVGKLPNGKFQIQLKRDLTDDQFARTLTEELLHVVEEKTGKIDYEAEQLLGYLERPTEKKVKGKVVSLLGEELFGIPVKKIPAEKAKPVSLKTQVRNDKRIIERLRESVKRAKETKEDVKTIRQSLHDYAKDMPLSIRGKTLTALKTAVKLLDLNEAMTKIDEQMETYHRKQYVRTIEKELTAKKIAPKKTPSGILKGKFTAEVQRALNVIKNGIHKSRIEALTQIEENIKAFEAGETTDIVGINELLNMQGIKEMTLTDLESTLDNIKTLKETGKIIKAEKEAARKEALQGKIIKTVETVMGEKLEIDEETGKPKIDTAYKTILKAKWSERGLLNRAKKFIDNIMNWQFGWDNLLDKLSALDKTSKPYESELSKIGFAIQYARINQIQGVEEVIIKLQDAFGTAYKVEGRKAILNKVAEHKQDIDLGTFENAEGHKIELVLNKEQLMKKYMQLEDPTLDSTFIKGMLYTDEIKDAIRGAITEEDVAYINGLRGIYDTIYEKVNPIYKDLYGVDLPRNPYYSGRIIREGKENANVPENLLQIENAIHYASVLNPSLKQRSRTLSPLKYNEATPDILRYVLQMEHFIAFAKPLQELRGIFGNSAVKAVIKQGYGNDIYRKITDYLQDITRDAVDKSNVIAQVDKLRGNLTRSILAKPIIGIKQVPSILAYMTEMPTVDFFKGIANFWKNPIKNYRTLIDLSPYAKERFGKGFERDIHAAMREGYGNTLARTHKFSDVFFTHIRMGDRLAVVQGMWAKMYSETGGRGSTASKAEMVEGFRAAERSTERTQPTYTIESLAAGQRGGSFLKLLTMFQNQINKYYRIIADNARNFRYGRGSRIKAASNITLAWVVLPLLFQLIGSAGKIKDKDLWRILLIGPLNDFLVFGQMARSIYGWLAGDTYDYQVSPVVSTMKELRQSLLKVVKWTDPTKEMTTEDFVKMVEAASKAVGQVVGMPTPYGVQLTEAARKGDWRNILWTPYALAEEEKKVAGPIDMSKIYEAMGIKKGKGIKGKVPTTAIDMNEIYESMGLKK